jgi:queuine tRNA-ribosyltransferase
MALDHCTPDSEDKLLVGAAMDRAHRWLRQSRTTHAKTPLSTYGQKQARFGIIQGGYFRDLREISAGFVVSQDLDGIAIGGETIGYDMVKTTEVLEWIMPLIPNNKPRYSMGVGSHPQDIIDVVAGGVDMFDCVAPTRNARHGHVFCGKIVRKNGWVSFDSQYSSGRINLKNGKYLSDTSPIMEDCKCITCSRYSRAHLQYLLKSKSADYFSLASIHNVQVMQDVCHAMRECILGDQN